VIISRHGNETRTRPGRRQKHSVKRDNFTFHIVLSRLCLFFSGLEEIKDDSACFRESGRVFVEFAVFAIDLASRTSQLFLFRSLVLSCNIVHQDADMSPFAVHRSLRLLRSFDEERRSSNGCRASRERIAQIRITNDQVLPLDN